jgi:hypothetical protein
MVADLFRSRKALEVEIWMLRQRINVLRRTAPEKQTFSAVDRLIFVCLYRLLPGVRDALAIVKPETVVDGRFYGLASQRIRPQSGSQIRSRKPAAGNRLPAISYVTGMGSMVRSSSEGFDQWAFAIDRRRGAPLGKNGYAERLIGSIRRECLDHVVVLSDRHLRHLLLCYMKYYNGARSHLSLEKDAPLARAFDRVGRILCRPILGGLHHQYGRI